MGTAMDLVVAGSGVTTAAPSEHVRVYPVIGSAEPPQAPITG
jgi:hypothetical protein